jgi:hypothetical protein
MAVRNREKGRAQAQGWQKKKIQWKVPKVKVRIAFLGQILSHKRAPGYSWF